jgi:hypothetical protein
MNDNIRNLLIKCSQPSIDGEYSADYVDQEKFAELIIKATLDQVTERAYYSGDRAWSDDVDRKWVELHFGLGKLAK